MAIETLTCEHCQRSGERAKGYRPRIGDKQLFFCERPECQAAAYAAKAKEDLGPTVFGLLVDHLCSHRQPQAVA